MLRFACLFTALAGLAAATAVAQVPGKAEKVKPVEVAKPNAQMKAVLDTLQELGPKPLETLTPAEARKQPGPADAVKALLKKQGKPTDPEPVGSVKDASFAGLGGAVPIRVYTPKGAGPFPVTLYFHGGGWVIATIDAYDASCRALCNAANTIVVSSHYRQAPESPFPAAAEDAFAAYRFVLANAQAMNGDPKKIAIAGESAGGNLATATAIRARDSKLPLPVHQLLVYPVTDNKFDTESYRANADSKPLNAGMMKWFWGHYLARPPASTPYLATPLQVADLSGLPPATVITAEIDPLRSEGKAYADKLKAAGVKVAHHDFPGVAHEFFGMGAVLDDAKAAVDKAAAGLKSGFGK